MNAARIRFSSKGSVCAVVPPIAITVLRMSAIRPASSSRAARTVTVLRMPPDDAGGSAAPPT
ncbi:hypothetical protein, partial [Microbacterium sp.]|uniref:hypothetical protein n=1 Tax=Microbacterium sp. TaxID=51671 RepID=UPI002C377C2E